ncbi:MAG TPA: SCO family protein [Stellaceae bacterium]|nr:SCO family protein [Stellaceae bacterium]
MNQTSMETRPNPEKQQNRPAAGNAPALGRLRVVLVSSTSGALLALAAVALFLWFAGPSGNAELPVIGEAPHYRLINQNGKPVSSQDFAGKVQIVTPLFPYCRELCPLVAANLAEFHDNVVQKSGLKGHVVFVFFNVAPADAGPAEMRAFLKQYGWNPDDSAVQFLTGSPAEIERVVERGYHIAYYRTQGDAGDEGSTIKVANPLADRVKPNFDVKHADTIEVVDGAGRIRKIFINGARVDDMRLQSTIVSLLPHGSS